MSAPTLVSSPFVASWIGLARPGEMHVGELADRVPAWASWAVESLTEIAGEERRYPALVLPGRFYSTGDAPTVRPHLEIPAEVLESADPSFPYRLAAAGNGLVFPQWVPAEIQALRRVVFLTRPGDPRDFLTALEVQRPALLAAVAEQLGRLSPRWRDLQHLLATDPAAVTAAVAAPATTAELNAFAPALAPWQLHVELSGYLAKRSGDRAARNLGIWVLDSAAAPCRLPVLTPRLTYSSLWRDELFDPYLEPTAALLVRGALLARLLTLVHAAPVAAVAVAVASDEGIWLRAQPARPGAALPHASLESAVTFLQAYPTASLAFTALEEWCERSEATLTVERSAHAAAHALCLGALRRSEDLAEGAIDELLPLVWQDGHLARLTVARRRT
jgi:hypothetical protein